MPQQSCFITQLLLKSWHQRGQVCLSANSWDVLKKKKYYYFPPSGSRSVHSEEVCRVCPPQTPPRHSVCDRCGSAARRLRRQSQTESVPVLVGGGLESDTHTPTAATPPPKHPLAADWRWAQGSALLEDTPRTHAHTCTCTGAGLLLNI